MTERNLLVFLAIGQGSLLAALVLLLLVSRLVRSSRRRRLAPQRERLEAAIKAWAFGAGSLAPVVAQLQGMRPEAALEGLVHWSARMPGERWQSLAAALPGQPWIEGVRAGAMSRQWWQRLSAARLLAVAAVPRDEPLIARLLADPHPAVHIAAVAALGRVESPALVSAALDRIATLPSTVQAYYAAMLRHHRALVLHALAERFARADSPGLARYAEFAARLEDPALRQPLMAHAGHVDPEVRVQVARALGGFPHAESVTVLERLAGDGAWEVRAQAVRALGRIGDARTLPTLADRLQDPVWWVRLRAALALARLGSAGRDALLTATAGASPDAQTVSRLILGLSPQALTEFAA